MNEPKCTVVMDEERRESTDFVAVLAKEDGGATLFYNTDAMTLGIACKMLTKEFLKEMSKLSEEDQNEICSILGMTDHAKEVVPA